MVFYGSEKRQALPEQLLFIIDVLMQKSSAMVQGEIGSNAGARSPSSPGFKVGAVKLSAAVTVSYEDRVQAERR
jgi:hypothetical protein